MPELEEQAYGPPGLYEVEQVGAPGTLFHRRVFDALEPPVFRYWPGTIAEDWDLCWRARRAGAVTLSPSIRSDHGCDSYDGRRCWYLHRLPFKEAISALEACVRGREESRRKRAERRRTAPRWSALSDALASHDLACVTGRRLL